MAISAFSHIRDRVREEITRDLDGDYWDDDLLDAFIDEGQLQYCRRSRVLREQSPIQLRESIESYTAPEDCYEITRIETADGRLIEPLSTSELQDIAGEGSTRDARSNWMSTRGGVDWREQTGNPQYWYQDLDGRHQFRFWPRPSPTIDTGPTEHTGLQEALLGDYKHILTDSEAAKEHQLQLAGLYPAGGGTYAAAHKTGIDLRYNPIMRSVGDLLYIYTSSQLFVFDRELRELWAFADPQGRTSIQSGDVSASGMDVYDGYSEESEGFGRAYVIFSTDKVTLTASSPDQFADGDNATYRDKSGGTAISQVSSPAPKYAADSGLDDFKTPYATMIQDWHESTPSGTAVALKFGLTAPIEGAATTGAQAYINADNTFNVSDFPDNGSFSFSLWCLPDDDALNETGTGEGKEFDLFQSHNGSGGSASQGWNLRWGAGNYFFWFMSAADGTQTICAANTSEYIMFGANQFDGIAGGSSWDYSLVASLETKWVHVAGRFDSSTDKMSIWIDNIKTEVSCAATGFTTSETLRIGGGRGGYPWYGNIDEVMIFNVALTDDEVTALYNDGNGVYGSPTHRGVKGIFHLDEGTGGNGDIITDSANNNHATIFIAEPLQADVPRQTFIWDTDDAKIEPPDILDPGYDRLVVSRSGRFLVTGKSGLGATPLVGGNIRARFTDGTKLNIADDGVYNWKGFLADTSKKFYQGVAAGDSVYVVMGADGGGYVKESTTGELAFAKIGGDSVLRASSDDFTVNVANGTVNGNDSFAHGLTWTAFQAAQDMYGICRVSDDLLYINVNGTLSTYVPSTDTLTATAITTLLATTPLHYTANKIWALNTASDLIRIDIVTPAIEHTYTWPGWAKTDSGDSLNFDLVDSNHGDRSALDLVNKFAVLGGKPFFLLPDASASKRQAFVLYCFGDSGSIVNIDGGQFASEAGAIVDIKDDESPVYCNQEEGLVTSISDADSALMFYIADPQPGRLQIDDTDALVAYAASRCYETDDEQQDLKRSVLFRARFEERLGAERKGSVTNYTTSRKRSIKGSFF